MPITDPTDIADLVFWGDISNIVEAPTGFVQTITNRFTGSGAYADLSAPSESARPALVAGTVPRADFDGVNDVMRSTPGPAGTATAATIFLVIKLPPAPADAALEFMYYARTGNTSGGPYLAIYRISGSSDDLNIGEYASADAYISLDETVESFSWGDDMTIVIISGSSTTQVRVNGIEVADVANVANMDGAAIGAIIDGTFPDLIGLYSLIIYDRKLTAGQVSDVEDYINENYIALAANAGADQSIVADESELATVVLDGSDSTGPVSTYQWHEGAVSLGPASADPVLILENVTVAAHTYTLTVTDSESNIDTDDVIKTVTVFIPPATPTIRTYKSITTSTATVHIFSDIFPLTDRLVAPTFTEYHNQLRVFKKTVANVVTELFPVGRPSPSDTTDFTINSAGTQITLDVALISSDTLVIMRDTQMNRAFVTLTLVSRFRGRDRNVRGNQILFIAQELRELRQIADILGDAFDYDPTPIDREAYSQIYTGDGVIVTFSYSDIEMLPLEAVRHTPQLEVYVNGVLESTDDYTVTESTLLVTFDTAPVDGELIELRRITRIDSRWVVFSDGSTFSSLQDKWDFLNIKFIIQETPDFPVFDVANALENRIFPRPLNALQYSGPGDTFYFGNLAWFGDGVVFIFLNDLELIDGVDYTIDFNFFFINITIVAGDILDIITTTPNHAWGGLGFVLPDGEEDLPADLPVLPEVFRGTADTMINSLAPTTNYDTNFHLTFNRPTLIPCLQFDVSDIDPADFSEIKLAYYITAKISILGADIAIRRCLRTWDITKMTWNEYATGIAWATAGAGGADSDYDVASEITWLTAVPAPFINSHWLSPDISALVTAARAGDSILRLLMIPQSSPVLLHSVGTVDHPLASKHPQLITFL